MKISKAFQLAAACLAIISSAAVLAGPQYKKVEFGGRVLVNNMTCTQVITTHYSDDTFQIAVFRDVTYIACEPNVRKRIGQPGEPGQPGQPGQQGPG